MTETREYTGPLPISEDQKRKVQETVARIRKDLEEKHIIRKRKLPPPVSQLKNNAAQPAD